MADCIVIDSDSDDPRAAPPPKRARVEGGDADVEVLDAPALQPLRADSEDGADSDEDDDDDVKMVGTTGEARSAAARPLGGYAHARVFSRTPPQRWLTPAPAPRTRARRSRSRTSRTRATPA